jgi:acyl-CoA dehydrogenase
VARPSNILMACEGEQRERYLFPAVRGEKADCLAMTEPGVGSDLRGMKTFARQMATTSSSTAPSTSSATAKRRFHILFAATGEEDTPRGKKKLITAFLIDKGTPGFKCAPATGTSRTAATQQHSRIQRLPRAQVPDAG